MNFGFFFFYVMLPLLAVLVFCGFAYCLWVLWKIDVDYRPENRRKILSACISYWEKVADYAEKAGDEDDVIFANQNKAKAERELRRLDIRIAEDAE